MAYGGGRDGGDAMSTINPDDIAQITLLKGASAAALYGAVAANGAIMITTKSVTSLVRSLLMYLVIRRSNQPCLCRNSKIIMV